MDLFTKLNIEGLITNYLLYPGLQQVSTTGESNNNNAIVALTSFQINQYIITHLPGMIRYFFDNTRYYIFKRIFAPKKIILTSSIDFMYINEPNQRSKTIESILDYICKKDEAIFLKYTYTDSYKPCNNRETFKISENISVRIKDSNYSEDGKLQSMSFQIFSTVLTLDTLKRWVKEIEKNACKGRYGVIFD